MQIDIVGLTWSSRSSEKCGDYDIATERSCLALLIGTFMANFSINVESRFEVDIEIEYEVYIEI
ncbi:hypothetical protein BTUL_0066g00250 [Botrytis tulipae]|uniref:Uncharacterized protein n=1 Tax=Botrytis tulipae TaxID=87230 RepID=A0A4Z1EMK9_9HELO|nr:hypothetical protein BTUL_0066g00250 [Botrytis tulipae]